MPLRISPDLQGQWTQILHAAAPTYWKMPARQNLFMPPCDLWHHDTLTVSPSLHYSDRSSLLRCRKLSSEPVAL